MDELKFNITNYNNSLRGGNILMLTLQGVDGDSVVLELNQNQCALIESRRQRVFYKRWKKERVLYDIDDTGSCAALETLAKKYDLCDACNFSDINLYGVKRLLKAIVETLYRYPRLRSKLCFIGTHYELEKKLDKLAGGDVSILKEFNLQYICTDDNARKLGRLIRNILNKLIAASDSYIATAMCAFGLFDSVLLDKNDYEGYAYISFISQLRQNEKSGYHPKGCYTPEYVVYHELGHLLDDMCSLAQSREFTSYYSGFTADAIKSGLSVYALTSPKEFIAEAFAEYMTSDSPRPIASRVGEMLNSAYGRT